MSANTDNTAKFEAEKEREAFLESIFKPFKAWYSKEGTKEQIKERKRQYGRFPLFWKGLKSWKNYEIVYAIYSQRNNNNDGNDNSNNTVTSEATINNVQVANNPSTSVTSVKPGSIIDSIKTAGARKRKRKSRWATETNTSVVQDSNISSRWSMPTADNLTGKVKILPSGFIVPAGLSMKDEDVFVYKVRLEQLKEKMVRVPEEAAKRDADPDLVRDRLHCARAASRA